MGVRTVEQSPGCQPRGPGVEDGMCGEHNSSNTSFALLWPK